MRHVAVERLSDDEIRQTATTVPGLAALFEQATPSLRPLLRNIFNLHLLADLLSTGVVRADLAAIRTQPELLATYWNRRIRQEDGKHDDREHALRVVVSDMIADKSLQASRTRVIAQLKSEAIVDLERSDILRQENVGVGRANEDALLFTHHILFDYAVARLIFRRGRDADAVVRLLKDERALSLMLNPSLSLAFADAWTAGGDRRDFWNLAFKLASETSLPAVARLVAPAVAADAALEIGDLAPLANSLKEVQAEAAINFSQNLVGALFVRLRLGFSLVGANAGPWMEFAEALSQDQSDAAMFTLRPLLATVTEMVKDMTLVQVAAAGRAARGLLEFGWYSGRVSDLASILSRDQNGHPMASPPVLWDIKSDPVLANVKLIAEAWDAAGLYQVGHFVDDSWKEWNGQFREDVRGFLKGDNGMSRAMAYRLTGSPDVYQREEREAEQSVNFVTCHDGFTLNDLVSFNSKRNEANGERNRDGAGHNLSWNCGVEGPTMDPEIERLRNRQIKNFLTLTLLAIGTPMLLMGDEVRRTQRGNNNAFCQNNEISWFDWTLVERHADIHRFVQELIAFRMNRDLPVERLDMTLNELLRRQPFQWHGVKLGSPDWSYESHTLAATVRLLGYPFLLHMIINAYWEALQFEIPPLDRPQETWRRAVDTYLDPPDDICSWAGARAVEGSTCLVQPRSIVLLFAKA